MAVCGWVGGIFRCGQLVALEKGARNKTERVLRYISKFYMYLPMKALIG